MRIYFKILGGHVHCRVFTTGSKCGDLIFTHSEWPRAQQYFSGVIFIDETPEGFKQQKDSTL